MTRSPSTSADSTAPCAALAVPVGSAIKRRMKYNCETTARFAAIKTRLSLATRLEKRSEWQAADRELELLMCEAHKLRIHLTAWEHHKPSSPNTKVSHTGALPDTK